MFLANIVLPVPGGPYSMMLRYGALRSPESFPPPPLPSPMRLSCWRERLCVRSRANSQGSRIEATPVLAGVDGRPRNGREALLQRRVQHHVLQRRGRTCPACVQITGPLQGAGAAARAAWGDRVGCVSSSSALAPGLLCKGAPESGGERARRTAAATFRGPRLACLPVAGGWARVQSPAAVSARRRILAGRRAPYRCEPRRCGR